MSWTDVANIRSLRTGFNRAIQARAMSAIETLMLPQYVVLPGSVGTPLSREEAKALFAKAFRDPTFIEYVRRTDRVLVSSGRQRAAETGTWLGRWRANGSERRLSGIYQAVWLPVSGSWRLLNESFVTIDDGA